MMRPLRDTVVDEEEDGGQASAKKERVNKHVQSDEIVSFCSVISLECTYVS